MERKLNLDVAGAVSEFERLMEKFLIKRILYRIIFRGKGLEFDSYRDFAPDDDASDIDWKASTRANKLLVKQYIEERDLKFMFVIDVGENMIFGSTEKLKCEYATEAAAAISHLILTYNDAVGFAFFSDKIIKIIFPKKGKKQFSIFVDELANPLLYGGKSDIKKALDSLSDYLNKSINVVIIISDFVRMKQDASKTLDLFSKRFETIAIMIRDPLDKTFPKIEGELVIEDPETKEQIIIDPTIVKKSYEKNALEQENMVKKIFTEQDIDFLEIMTNEHLALRLAEFLKERIEKRKHILPTK